MHDHTVYVDFTQQRNILITRAQIVLVAIAIYADFIQQRNIFITHAIIVYSYLQSTCSRRIITLRVIPEGIYAIY